MVAISILPKRFLGAGEAEVVIGGSGVNIVYFCLGSPSTQILPTLLDILAGTQRSIYAPVLPSCGESMALTESCTHRAGLVNKCWSVTTNRDVSAFQIHDSSW